MHSQLTSVTCLTQARVNVEPFFIYSSDNGVRCSQIHSKGNKVKTHFLIAKIYIQKKVTPWARKLSGTIVSRCQSLHYISICAAVTSFRFYHTESNTESKKRRKVMKTLLTDFEMGGRGNKTNILHLVNSNIITFQFVDSQFAYFILSYRPHVIWKIIKISSNNCSWNGNEPAISNKQ